MKQNNFPKAARYLFRASIILMVVYGLWLFYSYQYQEDLSIKMLGAAPEISSYPWVPVTQIIRVIILFLLAVIVAVIYKITYYGKHAKQWSILPVALVGLYLAFIYYAELLIHKQEFIQISEDSNIAIAKYSTMDSILNVLEPVFSISRILLAIMVSIVCYHLYSKGHKEKDYTYYGNDF